MRKLLPITVAALLTLLAAALNAQTWVKVANEGDVVNATATVRYGVQGCTVTPAVPCWVQKTVTGSFTANNIYFGSDPDPGVVKELDVLLFLSAQTVTVNNTAVNVPALVAPAPAPSGAGTATVNPVILPVAIPAQTIKIPKGATSITVPAQTIDVMFPQNFDFTCSGPDNQHLTCQVVQQ
jgi:hypothetical protein